MFYLIDIFVALFIIFIIFYNYKKGLIEVAFKIFSFFIAIIISLVLFKPISYFLINFTPIDEKVNSFVYDKVDNYISSKGNEESSLSSNLPSIITNYIDNTISKTAESLENNIVETVSSNISSTIINILSFLIVYIISRIVLIFVHFISDTISKLPIVKQFNEIGGLLYGLFKSFFIIFIVLTICSILPLTSIQTAINNTYLTLFLYNINPILLLFF